MKSVKPGRGPSMMGVIGAVVIVVFGIFWTIMAAQMGAPVFFPIFGVMFIIMGVAIGIYNLIGAVSKNRMSSFDITSDGEEPDPFNTRFGAINHRSVSEGGVFCPFCGEAADYDHEYCMNCGKKIPKK